MSLESLDEFALLFQAGAGLIVAYEPGKPITIERVILGGPADLQIPGQARMKSTLVLPFDFKLTGVVAQIKEGDILESVDGINLQNLPATKLTQIVRGKVKTAVQITIRRGDNISVLNLSRDFNRTNYFDNQEWEKAFGHGRKPSGVRTFLVL